MGWFLVTLGLTLVITKSRIGAPLRRLFPRSKPAADPDTALPTFGYLIRCPMCTGAWVGAALSLAGVRLIEGAWWSAVLWNGLASAGWCYAAWVALVALGAEKV